MFQGRHRIFNEFVENVSEDTQYQAERRGPLQVRGYVHGGEPRVQQRAAHYPQRYR